MSPVISSPIAASQTHVLAWPVVRTKEVATTIVRTSGVRKVNIGGKSGTTGGKSMPGVLALSSAALAQEVSPTAFGTGATDPACGDGPLLAERLSDGPRMSLAIIEPPIFPFDFSCPLSSLSLAVKLSDGWMPGHLQRGRMVQRQTWSKGVSNSMRMPMGAGSERELWGGREREKRENVLPPSPSTPSRAIAPLLPPADPHCSSHERHGKQGETGKRETRCEGQSGDRPFFCRDRGKERTTGERLRPICYWPPQENALSLPPVLKQPTRLAGTDTSTEGPSDGRCLSLAPCSKPYSPLPHSFKYPPRLNPEPPPIKDERFEGETGAEAP